MSTCTPYSAAPPASARCSARRLRALFLAPAPDAVLAVGGASSGFMTVRPTMPAMIRPTTVVYFFCVDRGGGTPAAGPPRRMLGCSRSVKGNRNMITTSTDSKREPERNPYSIPVCIVRTVCRVVVETIEYPVGSVVWRHSQKRERISGANRHMRPSDGVENGARAVRVRGSRSVFGVCNTSERVIDPGGRVAIHRWHDVVS